MFQNLSRSQEIGCSVAALTMMCWAGTGRPAAAGNYCANVPDGQKCIVTGGTEHDSTVAHNGPVQIVGDTGNRNFIMGTSVEITGGAGSNNTVIGTDGSVDVGSYVWNFSTVVACGSVNIGGDIANTDVTALYNAAISGSLLDDNNGTGNSVSAGGDVEIQGIEFVPGSTFAESVTNRDYSVTPDIAGTSADSEALQMAIVEQIEGLMTNQL